MKAPAGLDGVIVTQTRISGLDESGRLVYRGRAAENLTSSSVYDQVANLICDWTPECAAGDKKRRLTCEEARALVALVPASMPLMSALPFLTLALQSALAPREFSRDEVLPAYSFALPRLFAALMWSRGQRAERFEDFWLKIQNLSSSEALTAPFNLDSKSRRIFEEIRILYAEHGLNASTFTARVVTSTQAEPAFALAAAFGSFSGPIHGGATAELMRMMDEIESPGRVSNWLDATLACKQKVMGFGHRIYRGRPDSRFARMRELLARTCALRGDDRLLKIVDALVSAMRERMELHPNLDLPCGPTLELLGFARETFVPFTALSRLAGWCAHIQEQELENRIIRPTAEYVGPLGTSDRSH